MLKTLRTNKKGGFTLVEIMIVVAIIALLASIAVPNFMRARARSQATAILEELRLVDAAKDQYAIENNLGNGDNTVTWANLTPYLKAGSRLATETDAKDLLGNDITIGNVGVSVAVHDDTIAAFEDLYVTNDDAGKTKFWGAFFVTGNPNPNPNPNP